MQSSNVLFGMSSTLSFVFTIMKRCLIMSSSLFCISFFLLGKIKGNISEPKLRFWLPYSSPFYLNGSIFLSYPKFLVDSDKLITVFDHEISHHIQHSVNRNVKQTYPPELISWVYWFLTGKIRWGLADRAFQEGFAVYVAYVTTGVVSKRILEGKIALERGKRKILLKDPDVVPYLLGFLAYSALASSVSESMAIKLGLSSKTSDWVKKLEFCKFG
jgi:hypothetical protein